MGERQPARAWLCLIIGQLNGKITVESEAGQGSTFGVFLLAVEQ